MNAKERIKMVKAMEYISRQLNDESILIDLWFTYGVADGDIDYGDLGINDEDFDNLEYYIEDEEFADLMRLFMYCMRSAIKLGGLYCDEIVSKE